MIPRLLFPHRNGNSQHSQPGAIYTGPGRKFDREQVAREVRKAAQGQFDALVMLALDHPGPRAKVLAIVAEVLTQLDLVPAKGRVREIGRQRKPRQPQQQKKRSTTR